MSNPKKYEPKLPKGCDQQGRYPQAAELVCDEDERVKVPKPEPWWPGILGAAVGLLVFALVFGLSM